MKENKVLQWTKEPIPYGRGFSIPHATAKIFRLLNKQTLLNCRRVNSTWKNYLENPSFWFQKFGWMKIGLIENNYPPHLLSDWKGLAQKVEKPCNRTVSQLFVLPLIKMADDFYQDHPLQIVADLEESKSLKKPENYPVLVDFILENLDPLRSNDVYKNGIDEFTPIHLAAMYGKLEVMKNLVRKYETPNAANYMGETPILLAAMYDHLDIVKLLVDYTDIPLAPDRFGKAPISAAACNGNLELVMLLANFTDSPNAPSNYGRTPLYEAARSGNLEVVKFLEHFTDSPNAPDNSGRTPIHEAARSEGNLEIVKFLANFTASPNAPDNCGRTPIHEASRSKGNLEIVKFLANFTDSPNAPDNNGRTPIQEAARYQEIFKFLLAYTDSSNPPYDYDCDYDCDCIECSGYLF